MKRKALRVAGIIMAGTILFADPASMIYGAPLAGVSTVTAAMSKGGPTAGVSLVVSEYLAQSYEAATQAAAENAEQVSENGAPVVAAEEQVESSESKSEYADIAIAQVDNYVNIRMEPNTESEVLGKL